MESNVLVRYNPTQRSFMDPSSSTSSWRNSNDDVDFNDVFGGPPRRYSSASDARNNSISEATTESRRFSRGEDESTSSGSARWSGLGDKPVFGDEVMNRRRNTSEDFFDDIFRSSFDGKDSPSSLPSRTESYCSSPLPAQLSLPAKLNKGKDDNRKSSSSMEFSLGADGSVKVSESEADPEITLKKDLNGSSDVPINRSHFHFSIHKWASKGAPPMFSLRNAKSSSKVKDNDSVSRCISSDGRIKNDGNTISKLPIDEALSDGLDFFNGIELKKDGEELRFNTVIQDKSILSSLHEKCEEKEKVTTKLFDEANKSELKPLPSMLFENTDEQGNRSKNETTKEAAGVKENMESITKKSSASSSVGGGIKRRDGKRVIYNDAEEDITMPYGPPARSGENIERNKVKGKVSEFVKIFNQETPSKRVTNGNTQNQNRRREGVGALKAERAIKVNAARVDDIVRTPIRDEKKISVTSPVKEPPIQPKDVKVSATTEDKKLNTPTTENQKISVEEYSRLLSERDLGKGTAYTTIPIVSDAYEQKDSSSSSASISDGSKATITSIDDFFEDDFSMQEIFIDQTKPPEIIKDEEDFRASDAKIREWSYGKETNIRSLLSTLQYVLWDRSGWKPVPLVDIIEGNAVKRAYQRALLCLHPDKLQQKCATPLTKYIAEKVFDILQEAWENFNSLGSI